MSVEQLAEDYVGVWNETDPRRQATEVEKLWAPDGTEYLSDSVYRGHAELRKRVAGAYRKFVAEGGFSFVRSSAVAHHHDTIALTIDMVPKGGGDAAWRGIVFIELDSNGKIKRDYQFTT